MALPGVPVGDALDSAVVAITASGSPTPRLDAEVLLAHVLGVGRAMLFTDREREVAGPDARAFRDAVRRRAAEHEPVAYITGTKGFRHLDLAVDPRVLVPRPETELLVEIGLTLDPGARVADVGTGSGAVALALKAERPDLRVVGTDVSADALAVARVNAARLGLDVGFEEVDLLPSGEPVDAVLSNPPYVAEGDRGSLAADIVRHEPAGALFAGEDGLDVIRRLVPAAAAAGVALLAIEVGAEQAAAVGRLMLEAGLDDVRAERDLSGIERVVVGRR